MKAAGIGGRYYPEQVKYSKSCLITLGIGVKVTSSAVITVGLNRAAAAGVTGAVGVAAVLNNPGVMAVGAGYAADALFEQCRCKGN